LLKAVIGILQVLIGGLSIGAVYALVAVGFCLVWQTSRTINFAQGEFIAMPAFLILLFCKTFNLSLLLALSLTVIITPLILGVVMKRTIVQPLLKAGILPLVVATLALSILLRNSFVLYTKESEAIPSIISRESVNFGKIVLSYLDIGTIAFTILIIIGLQLFVRRTKLGKAMQAVSQNRETANIVGINVSKIITLTFIINAIFATMAAILIAPVYMVKYDMGILLGLKAFYSAIIGGFNQVKGALLGGILVGVIETFTAAYLSTQYKQVVLLVILIVVILVKPEGLLGTKEED
jgi:branched-chain amino acid transport system permease protein